MKSLRLLLLPFMLFLGSCDNKPPQPAKAETLVFGTYYGMCAGNCVNIYQLTGTSLSKDDSADYPALGVNYSFSVKSVLPPSKYNMAKKLLYDIPAELLTIGDKTYGCPDCHDQGGLYIQIKSGPAIMRYMIDFDNTNDQSSEVIAYKKKVADVILQLM